MEAIASVAIAALANQQFGGKLNNTVTLSESYSDNMAISNPLKPSSSGDTHTLLLNDAIATEATATTSAIASLSAPPEVYEGFWESITDKRASDYKLLRGSPNFLLVIIVGYLYFVLHFGPKFMQNREPFKLNKLLLVYNISMATANLWLLRNGLLASNYGLDTLGCGDVATSTERAIYLGYLFFLTKLVELLDTVFFVLRKKQQQITFLHVFHHSVVPLLCWAGVKVAPGGTNGFFPLINSFIHVMMYTYYGLSTLGPRIQPYLWWKRYLTRLQMTQFVFVIANAAYANAATDCKFPAPFMYMQAGFAAVFLGLFGLFYRNAYKSKRHRRPAHHATTPDHDRANNGSVVVDKQDQRTNLIRRDTIQKSVQNHKLL